MQPVFIVLFILIFFLLCLLGILANGFIVLVLSREWRRFGRLLPSDMILISLGVSRFCLQFLGMVHNFYCLAHPKESRHSLIRKLFRIHWHFLNLATFWFSAWLSVLFCMKIANFTHPTFLWLKWRFPRSVPWLLLGSFLGSLLGACLVSQLFIAGDHSVFDDFLIRNFHENLTYDEWRRMIETHYLMPLKCVMWSVPCFVFLISTVLLIDSLRRHAWTMRQNAHGLQDASTQAHIKALRSLVCFVVLYALSFMFLIIDAGRFFAIKSDWFWPWQILMYLCTAVHPFILILSNRRLQEVFGQLFLLARGFWGA
ncbi:taste receptor type 2 member 41 [Saccopteryx leptura]|uniref:taste receptor type 2 member 41 n=1 Tax=Saccopteryx leptura TaxID=249018 RepID=UPI00339C87B6